MEIGSLVAIVTIVILATGIPVAFGLGLTAISFLVVFEGFDSLDILAETFFSGIAEFSLVSIPMFIVMGAAIASSPAGRDLYEALDRWMQRVPGGLIISNIGACSIFAALSGSSPATCAAIGKMGIPGNAQARLSRRAGDRGHCGWWNTGDFNPAIHHHDCLRYCNRDLDWPVVYRRPVARSAADGFIHGVVALHRQTQWF